MTDQQWIEVKQKENQIDNNEELKAKKLNDNIIIGIGIGLLLFLLVLGFTNINLQTNNTNNIIKIGDTTGPN